MNKYPPKQYTVEVNFGLDIEPFARSYSDPEKAGVVIRTLAAKMNKNPDTIAYIRLIHMNTILSTHTAKPPRQLPVVAPDSDGVRRYPEFGRHLGNYNPSRKHVTGVLRVRVAKPPQSAAVTPTKPLRTPPTAI
jgi:hypothetical protein